jgi:hypothetical protein
MLQLLLPFAFAFSSVFAAPTPQLNQGDILATLIPLFTMNVTLGPAPKGCSKYELVVARGTGEPGPFGVIAGDTLVNTVTKAIPDSRGYAVQVPQTASNQNVNLGLTYHGSVPSKP